MSKRIAKKASRADTDWNMIIHITLSIDPTQARALPWQETESSGNNNDIRYMYMYMYTRYRYQMCSQKKSNKKLNVLNIDTG